MTGESASDAVETGIKQAVRQHIGPIATPDKIQFTPALPKTRSGKIMRRILRKSRKATSLISVILQPLPIQRLLMHWLKGDSRIVFSFQYDFSMKNLSVFRKRHSDYQKPLVTDN